MQATPRDETLKIASRAFYFHLCSWNVDSRRLLRVNTIAQRNLSIVIEIVDFKMTILRINKIEYLIKSKYCKEVDAPAIGSTIGTLNTLNLRLHFPRVSPITNIIRFMSAGNCRFPRRCISLICRNIIRIFPSSTRSPASLRGEWIHKPSSASREKSRRSIPRAERTRRANKTREITSSFVYIASTE